MDVRSANHTGLESGLASCECPECGGGVPATANLMRGEVVRCPDCSAELEVTGTAPIRLEVAPRVEEDWGE
ncbi:MAG: lysine biosynthesis protein LysW [Phycisphaeraceae bacterium]|nr:lysine biosynthesis protein LysW [Phycisphaerae bacterium]MBX3391439.1 lysine biosynthesis protein LysW [Phycisphaeraceae bacterium]HRJ50584.1 lysine biosynthesis protein LysW [Phycisphaerales bacterium]